MCAIPRHYLTPEEYLALERQAEAKSEYLHGEVFAMAGASSSACDDHDQYDRVAWDTPKSGSMYGFRQRSAGQRAPTGLYTYPEHLVICGQPQFEDRHQDTLVNPTVIFEILSRSTEGYDRGEKFANYRTLESLSDYILISQYRPLVEHYHAAAERLVAAELLRRIGRYPARSIPSAASCHWLTSTTRSSGLRTTKR